MIEKTQADIMRHWQGDVSKPKVSICCLAYNHEPYIADALDGFLKQETNFPFEVVINDDCSTDNTADIIKQYQEKYPLIIKPIFQTENQYSKGVLPLSELVYPNTQGEFLALCEGDDYWLENKLQTQYDIMVADDKLVFSFHKANEYDYETHEQKVFPDYITNKKYMDTKNYLRGGGGFVPTCSIMLKTDHYGKYVQLAKKIRHADADFLIQALHAIIGEVKFIDELFSVYRKNSIGSWNSRREYKKDKHYILGMRSIVHFHNELKDFERAKYLYIAYTRYAVPHAKNRAGYSKKIKQLIINMPYTYGVKSIAFNVGYFKEVFIRTIRKI